MTKEELNPEYEVMGNPNQEKTGKKPIVPSKLEFEAEEYISDNCKRWEFDGLTVDDIANEIYLASAEPREKQIEIDAEQIRALQKQNRELTDNINDLEDKLANADYQLEGRDNEIKELKTQIEQMKCCSMCKYYSMSFLPYWCTKNNTAPHCTSKCDKWEIKENG